MSIRGFGKIVELICFNALMLISLEASAQKIVKPFQTNLLLSGNFGELRATHFHSGVDFRTNGVEGWPVVCVKDGCLSRVSVSPTGYGLALYVEHLDGTTSVYAHLQRCNPIVTDLIRKLQYQKESFQIDENVKSYQLFFKQGDTIAYSGNSGSSGGPHLHFELRNTNTEHTLNPLAFYTIKDQKAPIPSKLYLYTIAPNGLEERLGGYAVKTIGTGNYQAGIISVPAGATGVGVHIVDYMNDSWNKLGVYRMDMVVGQDTIFQLKMDSCSFNQSSLINDLKDFECYKKKETVYRCFGYYQNQILGIRNHNNGHILVPEDSIVAVQLHIVDINGNRSQLKFKLKGKKNIRQVSQDILHYQKGHLLNLGECQVMIDSGSLFSSVVKGVRIEKDTVTGKNIYVLASKEVPLIKKAVLKLAGSYSARSLICEVDHKGRKWPINTRWSPYGLDANIGYLSGYTVVEDTIAPQITYLGKFANQTIRFKIKDDFSGIATYRGEVNGKWTLFSYDAKNHLLQCSITEPAFVKKQENRVKIRAVDYAGNSKELMIKVYR